MKIELDEICDFFTRESFDIFITKDKEIIIQHPISSKEEWEMKPNTNLGNKLNKFYSIFPEGTTRGDWKCIQKQLIKYYKNNAQT